MKCAGIEIAGWVLPDWEIMPGESHRLVLPWLYGSEIDCCFRRTITGSLNCNLLDCIGWSGDQDLRIREELENAARVKPEIARLLWHCTSGAAEDTGVAVFLAIRMIYATIANRVCMVSFLGCGESGSAVVRFLLKDLTSIGGRFLIAIYPEDLRSASNCGVLNMVKLEFFDDASLGIAPPSP